MVYMSADNIGKLIMYREHLGVVVGYNPYHSTATGHIEGYNVEWFTTPYLPLYITPDELRKFICEYNTKRSEGWFE
jgi:hypothetical protein